MTPDLGTDIRLDSLLSRQANLLPNAPALESGSNCWSFAELDDETERVAALLVESGIRAGDRVAVYLEKRVEAVVAMLAASRVGALFVPVNPGLRQRQAEHILRHSESRLLVTSSARLEALTLDPDSSHLTESPFRVLLVDHGATDHPPHSGALAWNTAPMARVISRPPSTDHDPVAILYTSGSTGAPKGVLLSHRNLRAGAASVATYLELGTDDRLMAVLPFSFDYGLNQLLSSLHAGACCRLTEYVSAAALVQEAALFRATTLAGVPTLWQALVRESWPEGLIHSLRQMTNTGGHLPEATVRGLREKAPDARLFLMYGLTEAFRSTYLDPDLVDRFPTSIGRAVPNAEIAVVRSDGSRCNPLEEGELVHRGAFVALGYWNDPEATAARFRPWPLTPAEHPRSEIAVWSGDRVYQDAQGLLYFAGRDDEMIKTSGYRVSPTEVESVLLESTDVVEAVALGVPDEELGEAVAVIFQPRQASVTPASLSRWCRKTLPGYMQPRIWVPLPEGLPLTAHGKIDRSYLRRALEDGTLQPEPRGDAS
ncbi:acyl-CoA ligase (AMP-forming), exosortase A system-associated [Thioalkalivibrio sp. ALJ1]|uniref:acyl-CoA ligase (AMP-forming), exosortase A system-associated n=1 Tax=Thioalkalivibrio sp. ALJ1 TaxID=1158144 RepID=UPI0005711ADA|nr:acyl-CoA ligase (AMP-forming), exosortase A system-associated [Thioalkalivibrio sp. ALJ1]